MAEPAKSRKGAALLIAIAIAGPAEGLRQKAYYDPVGILTVCEGHTGKDIDRSKTYSLDECKALMSADMLKAIDQVEACVPGLPPHQLAAWSDAVFNMGSKIVCDKKNSTAARMLASGNYADACRQLPRWNKAFYAGVQVELPGLTKRRAREMAVCLGAA